ncbi:unnamed protein product [Cyclocybe aegerita]|uniref:Enoyl reductase (ER) domain-containing protein n=1 Tax=Cyclocybe aegerita TaxID=1973307 RepID=A0A8S0WTP9_CYCAE|nr:unnamed protein product [Cyclocybe aegerita]
MTDIAIPDVQRAWINLRGGTPAEALILKSDWPVPKKLAPGEVLLKVQAGALNPIGYKFFAVLPNFLAGRPRVPEYDLSGVVVDTNKSRFRPGDEVYGWVPSNQFRSKEGALCQYVKVSEDWIVSRPHNVTPTQAAGFTLAGQTAYTAFMRHINIQPGQHIFVNGGSTAVGAFAIQLAKIKGAKVTASASGKNEEFVRRMGADKFVDYTKVSVLEYLESFTRTSNPKFDYILEAVGISVPTMYTASDSYLSPQGAFLSVGVQPKDTSLPELLNVAKCFVAMFRPIFLGGNKARWINVFVFNHIENMDQFQKYVAEGSLQPIVDSVYDFNDALNAYDRIMSKRATGKVVVRVDPTSE